MLIVERISEEQLILMNSLLRVTLSNSYNRASISILLLR